MSDDPHKPPLSSRAALIWLMLLCLLYLGLVPVVIFVNGTPGGYGFFEVILLPALVGLFLTGRSMVKLIRGEYR